ncbi:MAG: ATP-binding cassette domain-containing protein [Clostridia bacterium]|nr:ATP-binding cassette domain-containing protein [Clostridia bacterium]
MALITAQNLTLSYGQRVVVRDLSFSLSEGQRLLVCGENGSGKSTLVRTLVGLHGASGGALTYGEGVRGGIGYLPQKTPQDPAFPATAFEVASLGLRDATLRAAARRVKVKEALARTSAEGFASASFGSLSGGQRQRVLLSRALLSASKLLVLDEPSTGLDGAVTHELYHLLRSLSREGLGVLFVSHDISGALDFSTHVLHLTPQGEGHFYTAQEYRDSAHFCTLCREVHHV